MTKKYNPVVEDSMYWRYEDLVESWSDFIGELLDVNTDSEMFRTSVAHLAKKTYERGYEDAEKHHEAIDKGKLFWN
jgi:hypothetical protein